jgi:ketosteroid isomerase-like protein
MGARVLERLVGAVNAHDLDAIVESFSYDYVNETPAHPARGFAGRAQVRRNWTAILAGLPDVTASVVRSATDGDTVWSEWWMRGTRADGVAQAIAGVVVFGVDADDRARWARFYLEPVEEGGIDVDGAIHRTVTG